VVVGYEEYEEFWQRQDDQPKLTRAEIPLNTLEPSYYEAQCWALGLTLLDDLQAIAGANLPQNAMDMVLDGLLR
jgi:hypothetical protein